VIARNTRDAGPIPLPGDAMIAELPADAPPDAEELVVVPAIDAGRIVHVPARRDAGLIPSAPLPDTPNHRGTILVQVLTKPEGANLFEGTHYRGPGGGQLEEPLGATLTITCRQPGYKPGSVEVHFDGKTDAVLCVLSRIKICITGIKNPFDDCELDTPAPLTPLTPPAPSEPRLKNP
jgi:hypothetical protein